MVMAHYLQVQYALGKDSRMELLTVTSFKMNFVETGGRCKIAENEFRASNTNVLFCHSFVIQKMHEYELFFLSAKWDQQKCTGISCINVKLKSDIETHHTLNILKPANSSYV